jgi:hypothetical protein
MEQTTNTAQDTCLHCETPNNLIDCGYYALCDECGSDWWESVNEPA